MRWGMSGAREEMFGVREGKMFWSFGGTCSNLGSIALCFILMNQSSDIGSLCNAILTR